MLVLNRRCGEKLVIGECVTLTVLDISRGRVRLGVEAPADVRVRRAELALAGALPEGAGSEAPGRPVSSGGRHV